MHGDRDRPVAPGIVIEPFDPGRHDRSGFACGTDRLDNFLRFSARKQQKDDFTRVFVAVAEGSPRVLGYYALNAHAVAADDLGPAPAGAQYRQHSGAVSLHDRRGQKLARPWVGSDLAIDALGRALSVAGEIGLKLVMLDVIDDGGDEVFARRMAFYRRLGFRSFQDRPERMFIAMDMIRAMFSEE